MCAFFRGLSCSVRREGIVRNMEGYTLLQTLLVIRLSSGALVAHETVVDTEAFPVGIYLVRSCGVIPAKKALLVWLL